MEAVNLLHTLIYQLDRVIHFRKILEMAVHISPPSYYLVLKMQAIASACSDIVLLLMEVKSAQGSLVAVFTRQFAAAAAVFLSSTVTQNHWIMI